MIYFVDRRSHSVSICLLFVSVYLPPGLSLSLSLSIRLSLSLSLSQRIPGSADTKISLALMMIILRGKPIPIYLSI